MNGKIVLISVAASLSMLAVNGAHAQSISVRINGEPVTFQGFGPRQIQGRVMVPLRGVLEKLGAAVDWVPATRSVVASRGNLDLELPIGSRTARVNGREVQLDVPAMTLGGSTMVPLRFVGETLGADIRWDNATQTVLITTADNPTTEPTRRTDDLRTSENDRIRNRNRVRNVDRDPDRLPGRDFPNRTTPDVPPTTYSINSLTHNHPSGWLRAGEVLTVRMRGTPRGVGSFRVPGVVDAITMQEVSPGVYEGNWTVPTNRSVDITDAAVIGSIKSPEGGTVTSPLVQSGDLLQIDTAAPKVADVNPAPNTQVSKSQPLISATLTDQGGSGVAADRTRVIVDGRDVSAEATITGQFFTYTPRQGLSDQKHTVEVVAYDKAGNETRQSWSFGVATPAEVKGIRALQTDARGELRPGDMINVAMRGLPGGTATWTTGPFKSVPFREETPGFYTSQVRVRPGESLKEGRVVATLLMPDGRKFTETIAEQISIAGGPPPAPVITFPGPNDQFASPLVIRGTAPANSTVRLKIDYASRALGILGVKGTAAAQEIKVGADGKWESKPISVNSLLGRRDTEYIVSVVTLGAGDETSPVTTLRFR